jgi:hypothetical protein
MSEAKHTEPDGFYLDMRNMQRKNKGLLINRKPVTFERIAKCVSVHDQLCAALQLVRMSMGWQFLAQESQEVIDAAIAKATGEQQ